MVSIVRDLPTFQSLAEQEVRRPDDAAEERGLHWGAQGLLYVAGADPRELPRDYSLVNVEVSGFGSSSRIVAVAWASVESGRLLAEWSAGINWWDTLTPGDPFFKELVNLEARMTMGGRDWPYSETYLRHRGEPPAVVAQRLHSLLTVHLDPNREAAWLVSFGLWTHAGRALEGLFHDFGLDTPWEPARLIDVGMIEKASMMSVPPLANEAGYEWQARTAKVPNRANAAWNLDHAIRNRYGIFRPIPAVTYEQCPAFDCYLAHVLYERWRQRLEVEWANNPGGLVS